MGKRQAKDPALGLQMCSLGALAPGQVEQYIVFWDVELNVNIPKIGLGCDRYFATRTCKNYSRPGDMPEPKLRLRDLLCMNYICIFI